jgi:hypothetical protein
MHSDVLPYAMAAVVTIALGLWLFGVSFGMSARVGALRMRKSGHKLAIKKNP